jgi:hypothetical protein
MGVWLVFADSHHEQAFAALIPARACPDTPEAPSCMLLRRSGYPSAAVRHDVLNGTNRRLRAGIVLEVDFMDGSEDFLHLLPGHRPLLKCEIVPAMFSLGSLFGYTVRRRHF